MSRKLLQFHKTVIEDTCNLLEKGEITKESAINSILLAFEDPKDAIESIVRELSRKSSGESGESDKSVMSDKSVKTKLITEHNASEVACELVKYILSFRNESKIGNTIKFEWDNWFRTCLKSIEYSKNPDCYSKCFDYSFWDTNVITPMFTMKDNRWFFDSIEYRVQLKRFFVFNPLHLELAKKSCSRDVIYLIRNYVYTKPYDHEEAMKSSKNKTIDPLDPNFVFPDDPSEALKNKAIPDDALMERFESGAYIWDPTDFYRVSCGATDKNDTREALFQFAVKQGYPFRKETNYELFTDLYWVTMAGLKWIQYFRENYPREIQPEEYGSAFVAACSKRGDNIDLLRYLVEECNVNTNFWAGPLSCFQRVDYISKDNSILQPNIKCFEYCVSLGNKRCQIPFNYCMEYVEKHPEWMEQSEVIRSLFTPREGFQDKVEWLRSVETPLYDKMIDQAKEWFTTKQEEHILYNIKINSTGQSDEIDYDLSGESIKSNPDFVTIAAGLGHFIAFEYLVKFGYAVNIAEVCFYLRKHENCKHASEFLHIVAQ